MRAVAVIDGTAGDAREQSRALGGFLRDGLTGGAGDAETLVVTGADTARDEAAALAPTADVRLVRAVAGRRDLVAGLLAEAARDGDRPELFLFGPGPAGAELAARLATRTRGSVLAGVLDAELGPNGLTAHKAVYSGHLMGRFELTHRPWCLSVDAAWLDAAPGELGGHRILSEASPTGGRAAGAAASLFDDVEESAAPSAGDLAAADLLVIAGRGTGGRDGVERVAAAARRIGAAFGVTRPVAMNGWAPMDRLVGVSGARTAPRLCIVVGASGAPAFYWGIERARFIAAVDVDDRAAIVAEADAAVIGDGVPFIEELAQLIERHRGGGS